MKNLFTTHNSRFTKFLSAIEPQCHRAFTLAETLIVIGIIGVVAALTLPNLNHATGDKETVTRLQKAYSALNEAYDRATAIYGPASEWKKCHDLDDEFKTCWMTRVGEFLKISKSCNEISDEDSDLYSSCDSLKKGDLATYSVKSIMYQIPDGTTFSLWNYCDECSCEYGSLGGWFYANDICSDQIMVDINGPQKGKNKEGEDIFRFMLSDSLGLIPYKDYDNLEGQVEECISGKGANGYGTFWVLDYGNLDYLKTDDEGYCNDNPTIKLDGVTNTSCH